MLSPVITDRWRGGYRIIIDLEQPIPAGAKFPGRLRTERDQPGYVRFRVFGADPYATAPLGKRGRAYNGPMIAKTVDVPHAGEQPDLDAIRQTITTLHCRWPALWFYDRTRLGIAALFQAATNTPDDWVPEGADNLDDL